MPGMHYISVNPHELRLEAILVPVANNMHNIMLPRKTTHVQASNSNLQRYILNAYEQYDTASLSYESYISD